jgi:hypothetical protein
MISLALLPMSRRQAPIARSAMPLIARINAGRFTKAELARKLNVPPQNVTNWLSRGIPPAVIPKIAELCEVSTDDYLVEAGLKKPRAGNPTAGEPMTYEDQPLMERIERAFFWLTDDQKAEHMKIIESQAAANKAIAKEIGGKVQPIPDEYVEQHLRHPRELRRATDPRKKH